MRIVVEEKGHSEIFGDVKIFSTNVLAVQELILHEILILFQATVLFCVDFFMVFQISYKPKCFVANLTPILFFSCVNFVVVFQRI